MEVTWHLSTGRQRSRQRHRHEDPSSTSVGSFLHYDTDHQVLICTEHGYVVSNLQRHLVEQHELSPPQRKVIQTQYTSYAHRLCSAPSLPRLSPPLVAPITGLRPPVAGVQCLGQDCGYTLVSEDFMRQHCGRQHGWRKSDAQPTFWRSVVAQRFFVSGPHAQYFPVRGDVGTTPTTPVPSSTSATGATSATGMQDEQWSRLSAQQRRLVHDELQQRQRFSSEHEALMQKADEEVAKHDRTGWFSHTGWPQYFAGRNIVHISHCSRLPDQHETVLIELMYMFDDIWQAAIAGLATVDRESRRWLASPRSADPSVRPLARLQTDGALDRYAGYFRRFLCYIMRVWAGGIEAQERATISEVVDRDSVDTPTMPARTTIRSSTPQARKSNQAGDSDQIAKSDQESDRESDRESDQESDQKPDQEDDHSTYSDNDHDQDGDHHTSVAPPFPSQRPTSRGNQAVEVDHTEDARALFPWQAGQLTLMRRMYTYLTDCAHSSIATAEEGSALLLDILHSFIFFKIGQQDPYRSGLVHFLGVLGIDQAAQKFKRAPDYSYVLAGLVYDVRVLALEKLIPRSDRGLEGDEGHKMVLIRFQQLRREYLVDGSFTPMSMMLSLLAYSKHIAMETGNAGSISWSRDKATMFYRGIPIAVANFRGMIHDVLQQAEDMLWQDLMWTSTATDRFTLPLDTLRDDVTFSRRGYSFVSLESNHLQHGFEWMMIRMLRLTGEHRLQIRGRWQPTRIRRYLRRLHRFWRLLAICIHTQGGQPARGTELLSIRFRNGAMQDRNVFIVDGQVSIITRYHKSQALMDRPKIVPRFLPWRCGQLLAIYLVYVQPFQEHLRQLGEHQARNDHIFFTDKGVWDTSELTQGLQQVTQAGLGHAFGTLDYRHMAVSIGREKVMEPFADGYQEEIGEVEEAEVEEESALEMQSGRGEAMGSLRYGVPVNIVSHLTVKSMTVFRTLSDAWHRFLQLDSVDPASSTTTVAIHPTPTQPSSLRGHKRQLTRSAPHSTATRVAMSSHDQDHPTSAVDLAVLPSSPPLGDDVDEQITTAMRRLFGEEAQFHSDAQRQAVRAVMSNESPLVVVLPTGGGKTLLAMIPALIDPSTTTVLITPFRALTDDMVSRFQAAGIDAREWRIGEPNRATMMVISADIAASFQFLTYTQQLQQSGHLHRVFVDESHLIFTASDWRPKLVEMRTLRLLRCPIVLLTATLPPMLQFELEEAMSIRQARYIRASTVRRHHRYHVQRCAVGQLRDEALALCRRWQPHLRRQKGVVYCLSKAMCDDLAAELQCLSYHADHQLDRRSRLAHWRQHGGLIVATSALGTGVDIPDVVVVIHVDRPWSMIDFAQESGRAGRGGEVVDSIILVEQGRVEQQLAGGQLSIDAAAVASMIVTSDCRRWVMSEYLDGVGAGVRCEDGVVTARCDHCGEGLSMVLAQQQRRAQLQRQMEAFLDEMTTGCALCRVLEGSAHDIDDTHSTPQCQRHTSLGLTAGALEQFRRQIRYPAKGRSCHKCGIDQRWCISGEDHRLPCPWPHVLIPVVRCVLGSTAGFALVQRCGYRGGCDDVAGYARWLSQGHGRRVWDLWMSNAMVVLVRVFELLEHEEGDPEVP